MVRKNEFCSVLARSKALKISSIRYGASNILLVLVQSGLVRYGQGSGIDPRFPERSRVHQSFNQRNTAKALEEHDHALAENGMQQVEKLNNLYGQFYKGRIYFDPGIRGLTHSWTNLALKHFAKLTI